MKREVIAVDIDDVVSSQVDALIQFSNETFGTKLTRDDFMAPGEYWSYYKMIWGLGEEEGSKRFQTFLEHKIPLKQSIDEQTVNALRELKKNYNLEVVTSRREEFKDGTIEWLAKAIPEVFNGVHFVYLWDEPNEQATKAKVCREIGAGYLIDDNAEHCNIAAEAGVHSLLFGTYGWNIYQDLHPNVTRVEDWQGVLNYFHEKG